jgi:hypothetical protein
MGPPWGTTRARTGLPALKARVKLRGLAVIDKRTVAARHLLAWRAQLLSDLGGEGRVSTAQRTLVEMAARTKLYVDHVDAVLMEMGRLTTKRGRLKPLVEQRQRLVDSLCRLLVQLGLERTVSKVPTLDDYLAAKHQSAQGSSEPQTPETRPAESSPTEDHTT